MPCKLSRLHDLCAKTVFHNDSSSGFIQSTLSLLFFCWQDVASEPFGPSPFMPKDIDDDDEDVISGSQQAPVDNYGVVTSEKESTARENNVAKIKVVVC